MKKFIGVWGEGYCKGDATIEFLCDEKFDESWGYEKEDLDKINNLRVGESIFIAQMITCHSIVRIA